MSIAFGTPRIDPFNPRPWCLSMVRLFSLSLLNQWTKTYGVRVWQIREKKTAFCFQSLMKAINASLNCFVFYLVFFIYL